MHFVLSMLLISMLSLPGGSAWSASAEPMPELQAAQRAGWDTVSILAQGMAGSDPRRFPGMHAWLKDYRAAGGVLGKRAANAPVGRIGA